MSLILAQSHPTTLPSRPIRQRRGPNRAARHLKQRVAAGPTGIAAGGHVPSRGTSQSIHQGHPIWARGDRAAVKQDVGPLSQASAPGGQVGTAVGQAGGGDPMARQQQGARFTGADDPQHLVLIGRPRLQRRLDLVDRVLPQHQPHHLAPSQLLWRQGLEQLRRHDDQGLGRGGIRHRGCLK